MACGYHGSTGRRGEGHLLEIIQLLFLDLVTIVNN